eukprot:SAG31_NODE_34_length_31842_cov_31.677850_6_plen_156_part_00
MASHHAEQQHTSTASSVTDSKNYQMSLPHFPSNSCVPRHAPFAVTEEWLTHEDDVNDDDGAEGRMDGNSFRIFDDGRGVGDGSGFVMLSDGTVIPRALLHHLMMATRMEGDDTGGSGSDGDSSDADMIHEDTDGDIDSEENSRYGRRHQPQCNQQ